MLLSAVPVAAQAVVQADPVIVSETPLAFEAEGVSRIRTAESTPVINQSLGLLADRVANLHVNATGAGAFGAPISLRGLSNTPYFSDPSVAVYFDDLPLGHAFTFPTALFGFGTATVARGPQVATFSRSAEAGVITFSSVIPGDAATAVVRAGGGNHRARRAAIEVASARSHRADASMSVAYSDRDGYVMNTQLGSHVDDQRHLTGAARVRVRPTAASEITLQLLANRRRDGAQPLVPQGGPLFSVARGREGVTESDFAGGALKLAVDTAAGRLSATTSRTSWTLDPYANRLVLPPTLDSQLSQRQRAWNEEIRLASAAESDARWEMGIWLSETDTRGGVNRAIPGLFPIEVSSYDLESKTRAVFGQVSQPVTSRLSLAAGLRLEQVSRRFDRRQTVPAVAAYGAKAEFDAALPKLTATYALANAADLSISISRGARPGGWSAYTDQPHLARFAPEKVDAGEIGVDTETADRTLALAVRVFAYRIRDYQIERSFTATDYLVVNAARARALGGEVEAAWRATKALTLTAAVGITEITLRRFTDPFTGIDHTGRRAPYAPTHDAHLAATYRRPDGWFFAADVSRTGRTHFDETEDPQLTAGSRTTANAQLGYDAGRWRVTLHAENLTDREYVSLIVPGIGHAVPGAPRTYGVEVAVKW